MANWMSIDFGTSSSAAAIICNRQPGLVTPLDSDALGSKLFPTVAYVDDDRKIWVCHAAERMGKHDISRFLRDFKSDIRDGVISDLGVTYSQLVAGVLKVLKETAEKTLNESIENLILTIPATYHESDVKTSIMKHAAGERGAGFKRIEILKEAQAAAIYYDFVEEQANGYTLVYDLGGGTFDAAIIKHMGTEYCLISNNAGLPMGGKYFTEKILTDYLTKTGKKKREATDDDLRKCEDVKRQLSNCEALPSVKGDMYTLTRGEFERMISTDLDKTLQSCNTLISETGIEWKDIDHVLLIGGSCHIPLVQSKIKNHLTSLDAGNTRVIWKRTENEKAMEPQFAVALGAAVYAMKNFMELPIPLATIGVLKNTATGEVYHLKEGENIFGRDDSSDFSFPNDLKMSRNHFCIEVSNSEYNYKYLITDLESSLGTIAENMALTNKYAFAKQSTLLMGGEKIIAGKTKFEFII